MYAILEMAATAGQICDGRIAKIVTYGVCSYSNIVLLSMN